MTKMSDLRDPKKYNNQHFDLMGIVSKQTNKLFNIIFLCYSDDIASNKINFFLGSPFITNVY